MVSFDYLPIARKAGIASEVLVAWRERLSADYPADDMMVELRLLRMCQAVMDKPERLSGIQQAMQFSARGVSGESPRSQSSSIPS